jgi:hypothetical protein
VGVTKSAVQDDENDEQKETDREQEPKSNMGINAKRSAQAGANQLNQLSHHEPLEPRGLHCSPLQNAKAAALTLLAGPGEG